MIAFVRRVLAYFTAHPVLRIILQTAVSLAILSALIVAAERSNVLASLQMLSPSAIALAVALQMTGFVLNSKRWQLLLNNAGVRERLGHLTMLYFIGQFFSLFLPTSTGGDAVRVYDVARRSQRPAQTIMATLQERLLGLGGSLLIGLVATLYYLPLVPVQLRIWTVIIQIVGAVGISLLLYPTLLFRLVGAFWRWQGHRPALQRLVNQPTVARALAAVQPIATLPPLSFVRLLVVLGLAVVAILMGIGAYFVFGVALGIQVGFMAFCLAVPLVWIIRMLPVSLNGVGVGEGAFVFLMGLFAVPQGQALALALAMLALYTGIALFGGLLLLVRMVRGTWTGVRSSMVEEQSA